MSFIIRLFKKNYYLLTVVLVYLSFPTEHILLNNFTPVLAWIALVPAIVYFRKLKIKSIYKYALFSALLVNYMCFGWMRSFGSAEPFIGPLVIVVSLIPAISVFWMGKFILSEFLIRKFPNYSVIIYPSIWTAIDFIQSIGYLAFPWIYLGYTQYQFDSLIQITSITGILTFNFIIIFSNALIAEFIIRFFNKQPLKLIVTGLLAFCIFLTTIIFWGSSRIKTIDKMKGENELKFSIVQSAISPWENWNANRFKYLADLIGLSNAALNEQPDSELLLWSESSTLENISYSYEKGSLNLFERRVLNYANNKNITLITGELGRRDDFEKMLIEWKNNAVIISGDGTVTGNYSKIHLCPFGEWFPYDIWMPWVNDIIAEYGGSKFAPGTSKHLIKVNEYNVGMLICYESMFFRLNRKYSLDNADFLINITNDGWSDYYKGHMQHFAASKFRAVENGRWLIRAGNTGYSAVIDPSGQVVDSIPILQQGYLNSSIDPDLKLSTFYTRYGDLIFYIIQLHFIILLTFTIIHRKIYSRFANRIEIKEK